MALKPEQKAWKRLREILIQIPCLTFDRVENELNRNMPDITYSYKGLNGWIELKTIPYVKHINQLFSIPHLTEGQKTWLKTRGAISGSCWLLVYVPETKKNPDYIILIPHTNVDDVGVLSWSAMLGGEVRVWAHNIDPIALAERLEDRVYCTNT